MRSRIHVLRAERRISQSALAPAADLDAHTVGRAERDGEIDKLKLETARKIADALGVGVDDLYERGGGEGETL